MSRKPKPSQACLRILRTDQALPSRGSPIIRAKAVPVEKTYIS